MGSALMRILEKERFSLEALLKEHLMIVGFGGFYRGEKGRKESSKNQTESFQTFPLRRMLLEGFKCFKPAVVKS